ncbi:hypothetical protein [Methylocapsa sp. S129]|uniref:hypothetical protein n=1 Tax=Methylocapsa sp. S129 TaxID=1641869 RepID=UPI00131D4B80|nr:hypothetical protein [Methylocapsa sp. S129]
MTIANCIVRHFSNGGTGTGIIVGPSGGSPIKLAITDTASSDNRYDGIEVQPTGSGGVIGIIKGALIDNNSNHGLYIDGSHTTGQIALAVVDSVASNNSNDGFGFDAGNAGAGAAALFDHVTAIGNGTGLSITNFAVGSVRRSNITGNTAGVFIQIATQGVAQSSQDNLVTGNGTDFSYGSFAPISLK